VERHAHGEAAIAREAFQEVAVSPDGASVAFAVTDEFPFIPPCRSI